MAQKYQFGRKKESGHDAKGRELCLGSSRAEPNDARSQSVGSVLWGEDDSDVGFHDNELFMATLGAMYRFGAR